MPNVYGERWEVLESLGEGGQGHVFRVRDLNSPGGEYALKRLKKDKRVGRFEREIEAVKGVGHPGIIRVVDYSVKLPDPYYVMEYMQGGTLTKHVDSYKGDILRSLDVVARICDVIRVAHEAKVCHRDLKPGNILFRTEADDSPVVADFGICWMDDGRQFTASNEVMGARHYTAPEVEAGKAGDFHPPADSYSLGKLLYFMVSGGRDLPREQHRSREFDLRENVGPEDHRSLRSAQLEYVSELLDHLVDPEPNTRWYQMDRIQHEVNLRRRLAQEGHCPLIDEMPCKFCGRGVYRVQDRMELKYSTSAPPGIGHSLRVRSLQCDHCGHLQLFEAGAADGSDEWRRYGARERPPQD